MAFGLLSWAAIVAASAAISAGAILVLRPILVRHLLAHPNHRSSHKVATPQGGGLGVMLAVVAVCALAGLIAPQGGAAGLIPVLGAACFLTLLGAADDAHALSVSWRFIGQTLAALAIVLTLPAELRILSEAVPLWLERALLVAGTVGFVNAVNFLDGLDWMTVAEVVPITLAVAALCVFGVVPEAIGLLALALLGAMLGFAVFNKHPASIFLGDAGSLPIGLCLALMLIYVAEASLTAAVLLPLYMIADTGITLARRIINKEPFLSAHRSHYYQRAVSGGLSVPEVTSRIFLHGVALALLAIGAALSHSLWLDLAALALGALLTAATLRWLARGRT
ncbi:glycosyl transferase [Methyloceanibacter sp.]|uniref:glycosyl transferase n=1 Tax=Methyloceanibacter sp. TaxID=1965321 RepID=UPI002D597C3D|nr:glycosyl transferase [Methyloceanibacter sp.]HZP09031.1 glycosyl transferase [Methyloceanibacter sp.]